jgi:tripartite-type tricarboxylate transporter receptor subunit TctC
MLPMSMLRHSLAITVLCVLGVPAMAQSYPSRTVRLVVPYAAGGGTDSLGRFLARGMEARLGQPVIVENKPGSGTTTGGLFVAKAEPDGYTLLMATSSTVAIAPSIYKNLAYDPAVDFTPITMIAQVPFVLTTSSSLPVSNVAEFIKLAKSTPGGLSYGSGGAGSPHHVFMELFKAMTGTDLKHVPYRGGGPAQQDVVAGHIPAMFADIGPATELMRSGKLRLLAVTTSKRSDIVPDIPTLDEAGVKGYEANSWQCVVGPAKLPAEIVARLNKVLAEVVAEPASKAHFQRIGMQAGTSTPAENGAYIKSEVARWAKVIQAAGIGEPK